MNVEKPLFAPAGYVLPPGAWDFQQAQPGIDNLDLCVRMFFKVTESDTIEVRMEAFNFFKVPDFSGPGLTVGSNAGVITGTSVRAGQIQFALKFSFYTQRHKCATGITRARGRAKHTV